MENRAGDVYFVEDGNHRVSVARAFGWETIRAMVTVVVRDDLVPDPACSRLGFRTQGRDIC